LNNVVQIGVTTAAQQASNSLITLNTEIQGKIYIGTSAGNISTSSAGAPLRFSGSARNSIQIQLMPEFPGAVMTGDGTNNVGTMTSDFCSGSSRLNINVSGSNCSANDEHNYYSWTAQATNDYDIWSRWQVPSNFSAFDTTAIQFYGWRTASTESIVFTVYKNATSCGTVTMGGADANLTWNLKSISSLSGCTINANDTLNIRMQMTVGTNNDYVRMGEITINYLSAF
jgi:hypothetical protein